jgi:hypothetical protein
LLDDLKRLSGPAKLATGGAVSCLIGIGLCGVGFSFEDHRYRFFEVVGQFGVLCFWGGLLGLLIAFAWVIVAEIYKSWRGRG